MSDLDSLYEHIFDLSTSIKYKIFVFLGPVQILSIEETTKEVIDKDYHFREYTGYHVRMSHNIYIDFLYESQQHCCEITGHSLIDNKQDIINSYLIKDPTCFSSQENIEFGYNIKTKLIDAWRIDNLHDYFKYDHVKLPKCGFNMIGLNLSTNRGLFTLILHNYHINEYSHTRNIHIKSNIFNIDNDIEYI
jgi:hypothetical protein